MDLKVRACAKRALPRRGLTLALALALALALTLTLTASRGAAWRGRPVRGQDPNQRRLRAGKVVHGRDHAWLGSGVGLGLGLGLGVGLG